MSDNYFAMAQGMVDAFIAAIISTIQGTLHPAKIYFIVSTIIVGLLLWHVFNAYRKGMYDGTSIEHVLEVLLHKGVKSLIFIFLGGVVVGALYVKSPVDSGSISEAAQGTRKSLVDWLGSPGNPHPAVMSQMKAGMARAAQLLDEMKAGKLLADAAQKVREPFDTFYKNNPTEPSEINGEVAAQDTGNLAGEVVKGIVWCLVSIGMWFAQWSMIEALVVQYAYISIAYTTTYFFLPTFIVLAYFDSLRGFIVNAVKHIVFLLVGGQMVGVLAVKLYSQQFWKDEIIKNATVVTQGDIQSFVNNAIANGVDPTLTNGMLSWQTDFMIAVTWFKLSLLLGLSAVLLRKTYSMIRATLDGGMPLTYTS